MKGRSDSGTVIALIALLAGVCACRAGDISYDVNMTGFTQGSVTGSITTDGTIGTLAKSDVVSWNLQLNESPNTYVLMPVPGNLFDLIVAGADLTATPNQLRFDFSATDSGYVQFQGTSSSNAPDWFLTDASFPSVFSQIITRPDRSLYGYENLTGVVEIAGSAPEPPLFLPLGMGLLGIACCAKRGGIAG